MDPRSSIHRVSRGKHQRSGQGRYTLLPEETAPQVHLSPCDSQEFEHVGG
jgi:hypothetical protein